MNQTKETTPKKISKEQQIFSLLNDSASVLICLPHKPSTDAIASGLALLSAIEKLGKKAKVVSSEFRLPINHQFLPKSNEIFDDISSLRQFIISLDVTKTSVEELSYAIEGDKLNIYISPKDGMFTEQNITSSAGDYAYDVSIVLDCPDIEQLGPVYERNREFFYHTPIINIDHSPENIQHGQINLVNVTATSTSELVFELIKDWDPTMLDEYIATNLLTGMISKTKSFQSGSVTPRSLAIASHLISQGARREDIVKHLYQSKRVSTLRLWGRALSKLQADAQYKIVWSKLNQEDFAQTRTAPQELPDVIDELIINTPEARNVFILYTINNSTVEVIISTAAYINALELFSDHEPKGSEHFVRLQKKDVPIDEVEKLILQKLKTVAPPTA